MTLHMYDAAFGPDLAKLTAHQAAAGSHYMTRSYAGTSFQTTALRAHGLGALHNMEGYADELKGASRAKGRAIAEEACAAFTKGAPRDGSLSIVYSVDVDLTDLSVCDEAFRGINDVHGSHVGKGIKVAAYAEGGLLMRLDRMGLVQGKQWLSMSEGFGAFQAALKSGVVGIVQMHDAAGHWIGTDIPGTDRNTIIYPRKSGIWWPAGSPYAKPAPVPPSAAGKPKPAKAPTPVPTPAAVKEFTVDPAAKIRFDQLDHKVEVAVEVAAEAKHSADAVQKMVAAVLEQLAAVRAAVESK